LKEEATKNRTSSHLVQKEETTKNGMKNEERVMKNEERVMKKLGIRRLDATSSHLVKNRFKNWNWKKDDCKWMLMKEFFEI
jgi:hypothetical protein